MSKKSLSLGQLAELTQTELDGDPEVTITGVASLLEATPDDVSYLVVHPYGQKNPRYEQEMRTSDAGAIIVADQVDRNDGRNYLIASDPTVAFQIALEFFLDVGASDYVSGWKGVHPSAIIHPTAAIDEEVTIGPLTTVDQGATIRRGTIIGSHCSIGVDVEIGEESLLHPHVTIRERCRIGRRVILHPGVVIGACGFGYRSDAKGHHKLRQLGVVIIEDDVEIGANSAVDRARYGETRICRGTKIDNLVQIGHGVVIGEDNIIVGQVGIAGSTATGKRVVMAGQTAINGHITIADDVVLAGRSAVHRSITKPGKYCGAPAVPIDTFMRNTAAGGRLAEHIKLLKSLERRVNALEK